MSIPVMLALSMSMSLFGSVSRKLFAQNTTGSAAGIFWLSSISSVMSALVLALMAGFHQASVFTWLLGIAGAVAAVGAEHCAVVSDITMAEDIGGKIAALTASMKKFALI